MKKFAIMCVVTAVVACVSSVKAGEVSKSTLGSLGLGSMQQLSDNDGLTVRGKGTSASVWGQSTANFHGGNTSTNGYEAAASHRHGSSTAAGANLSAAGVVSNHGFVIMGAGGGSFAYAK